MNQLIDFPYQHVLVLGLAKSGTAATKVLVKSGKRVRVNDLKTELNDPIVEELQQLGVEVITGGHPLHVLDGIDVLVKNPGIPYSNIIVQEAERRKIPILTEVELAGQLASNSLVGITGSNGKTTTTTLIYEMLNHSKQQVKIAGNIGTVAIEVAEQLQQNETMVIELSSFQLLGVQKFKPTTAVVLNLFEAHLDYHETFDNYKNAKANIFMNQTSEDFLVYNLDDKKVVDMCQPAKATKVPFSTKEKVGNGAWCDQTHLYFRDEQIILLEEIALVGQHNLENILAAVSAAMLNGATKEAIHQVLTTFTGVRHRLQFVENIKGRLFYNDSKATNVLATSKALSSFDQPTILLAGGLDRGNDFDDLIPYLKQVKAMVVFGETAEKLMELAEQIGIEKAELVDNVKHAVQRAYQLSNENDVILLSPACASWDQYRTFEERGDMFIEAVHTLK
ncbi:UDP-N-acetylmuramoyl-L-alanine--D-glutamate ligase [Aquibacillus koreensis]|uniref:UDP-N-acetylmuramoylalanine--D-glutamate ligase n=1 Tax=Aquibacillus koreensis TaxID=279446 RepID=A0A9X3WIH3_9BACI|nr:UDP-N-acetylmuramoyl-L-alanine--D-glutamate ligase [Aquibacillus koreensis]MCT2538059.1 UDP-N-acetylmuramoyl-L-alanine--D-glutamate ligase [Aquibacillus koreensis]MDC3420582.1 UDP-N-acetylmuramoyl-L-alanine--D-glutamate ligase [Aquibacillus koreensis]